MNISYSKKTSSQFNSLGVYQIIGGGIGILFILWAPFNSLHLVGILILIYLFMLLFFAFSIYCGILCLRKNAGALKFSSFNQAFQIIAFAMFGFGFQYSAGIYLTAGLVLDPSVNLKFGTGVSIAVPSRRKERLKLIDAYCAAQDDSCEIVKRF